MSALETTAIPAAFAAAGAVLGWVYFRLLRFSLRFLEPGRRSMGWFGLLAISRLALFAAGAAGALLAGIWPLIAYTAAFIIVRTVIIAHVRAEPAQNGGEADG